MTPELRELYQELIIDHGRYPRNCYCLHDANLSREGFNPLCGDRLILYMKTDQQYIVKMSFQGSGCAISVASASLMTEGLTGKTTLEAKKIFDAFHLLVTSGNECDAALLGKLMVLKGVCEFPARVKCATLAWHTMMAALDGKTENVTTE